MATAPTPGVGKRAAQAAATQSVIVLTLRDVEYRFALNNVPIGEQELCLKQSGFPYETFITEPFGTIKMFGLWWLARRAGGERGLAYITARAEWEENFSNLSGDEVDVRIEEPDAGDNDPEA